VHLAARGQAATLQHQMEDPCQADFYMPVPTKVHSKI